MRPLVTGADTYFESFTGLDSADPVLSEEAAMQKSVAGPIREMLWAGDEEMAPSSLWLTDGVP